MSENNLYDVVIIGTGAGTARDCAMRGLKVLLVEKRDFTNGATGRNHGLLHSGARYAVTDQESAMECIQENQILRRIARHCVEETDGLFITLPEDDLAYQQKFVEACQKAGIRADVLSPEEARRLEPAVNPALKGERCSSCARRLCRSLPSDHCQHLGCQAAWCGSDDLRRGCRLHHRERSDERRAPAQ